MKIANVTADTSHDLWWSNS